MSARPRRRLGHRIRHGAALGLSAAVLLAACGGGSGGSGDERADPADGGWVNRAPDFDGSRGDATKAAPVAGAPGAAASERSLSAEASADDAAVPPDGGALRAGSVDDNTDFEGFLTYLERIGTGGVPFRRLDPTGRIVITVRAAGQRPVPGAEVSVFDGSAKVVTLRTTSDGTVRFHPRAYGAEAAEYRFEVDGRSATAAPGASATIDLDRQDSAAAAIDLMFVIDATGSMGDEIDRLRAGMQSMAKRINALDSDVDLRLGMVVFRDEGDTFVTATNAFTSDVAAFSSALDEVTADGGGDTPEAVDEALAAALDAPGWRPAGDAAQLVVLVGDAAGHADRTVAVPYTDSMRTAATRGIRVLPIASSNADDAAEVVFRQLAQFTGGRFVFLSYGAGGAARGGSGDIARTDYEELSLDDLIVRLVAEDLSTRLGRELAESRPATTTTRPAGQ